MSENNKPVYRLKYGNVVAAVWANNSLSAGYFFNTTFQRVFPLDGGGWGDSSSFDDRDLLNLAKAAADIFGWIYEQKSKAVTVTGPDAA